MHLLGRAGGEKFIENILHLQEDIVQNILQYLVIVCIAFSTKRYKFSSSVKKYFCFL